jgi:hypothetical protein
LLSELKQLNNLPARGMVVVEEMRATCSKCVTLSAAAAAATVADAVDMPG